MSTSNPPDTGEFDDLTLAAEHSEGRRREYGAELAKGQALGRYIMLERLGAGGMGVVYAAFDPELDRKVAIKLLHGGPSGGTEGSSGRARLIREAQSIARISHPNVVAVHDVGTFEGNVFVAMEYIAGQTLGVWLDGPRKQPEILATFVQAGRGLAAAHAAGVIHRDFKPENVLLGEDGRTRVLDFGLARAPAELREGDGLESSAESVPEYSSGSIDIPLTVTGAVMGTPAYMAPEQHLRGEVDARTDQFAFCVALWEALYKERPFAGENLAALAFQVTQGKLSEPPREANVPAHLRRALERGLSLRREGRFDTMTALLTELERDPSASRRRYVTGAAAVAVLAGVSWLGYRGGEKQATQVCAGATEKMAGVWDSRRREAAEASFTGSELAYASDSWERVDALVEAYVGGWTGAYVDACEATHVRGEQSEEMLDLRMACLERRRRDLRSTTDLLVDADKDVIVRAVKLGHGLPKLDACADLEALAAGVQAPPEEIAEAVDALEQQISELDARYSAGKYAEVSGKTEALVAQARELGYRPSLAAALRLDGDAKSSAEGKGLAEIRETVHLALEIGDDELAVMEAFSLAYVLGAEMQSFEDAEEWMLIGEALSRKIGRDPEETGAPINTRAVIASHQGKHKEAGAGFARVVEVARIPGAPQHQLATALGNLGGFFAQRGELAKAREVTDEAVKVGIAAYGPKHPALLNWKANLGAMSVMEGDLEAGRRYLEETLALQEEVFGEGNPAIANTVGNLAIVYRRLRDEPKAEQMHRRALKIRETALGPDHPDVADSLRNLASAVMEQDRPQEAIELLERAEIIARKALGPDHIDVSRAHGTMSQALAKLERHEEALDHAKQCLEILERRGEPEHIDLLEPLLIYGERLEDLGRGKEALPVFERALALAEKSEGDPRVLADARFSVAEALGDLRRQRDRADGLANQALAYFKEEGEHEAKNRVKVERWLADR